MLRYLFTFVLIIAVSASFAQKKKKGKKSEANTTGQSTSLAPYYPTKNYEPTKKNSQWKVRYDNKAHEKRMAQVAKEDKKNRKEMAKPENSDPLYFGHKRPPKKRPPNKMKFCKVCGIRH